MQVRRLPADLSAGARGSTLTTKLMDAPPVTLAPKDAQPARSHAAHGSALTRDNVWNGWTSNYRPESDGYIIHACVEVRPMNLVAICGSGKIQETGMLNLADGWQPGCIKCRKKLRKLGLLPTNDR